MGMLTVPRIAFSLACAVALAAVTVTASGCGPVSRAAATRVATARPAATTRATTRAPGRGAAPARPASSRRPARPAAPGRPAGPGRPAPACPVPPPGVLSAAPGAGKTVALTFDDGPGRSTPVILAILGRYRVPATFFNIGQDIALQPSLVRREAMAGYVLGDHTWDHPDMPRLPAAAQSAQLARTSAELRRAAGTVPCLFRPPFGEYSAVTVALARQQRMAVWLWSVDTQDWMAGGSGAVSWTRRIIALAEAGAVQRNPVILMHNQVGGNPATVAALPVIIRFYQSRRYRFVAL
jgi:peptidoglycan/xylan/chitin deacetylase (PgdA/CDA1 family)